MFFAGFDFLLAFFLFCFCLVRGKKVASAQGFGVGEVEGVYALAQCWNTLGSGGCRECLRKAGREVKGCLPKKEGRALNAGCYLRYSTQKFYNEDGDAGGGNGKNICLYVCICEAF